MENSIPNNLRSPFGSVVLVTGASSGIGKCLAERLTLAGYTVYGGSRREAKRVVIDADFSYEMLTLDVTDSESVKRAVSDVISTAGHIDILVNCAGTGIAGAVEECTGEEALRQMDTNYAGTLRMIGAVLPGMRERRNGLIINIGSVGGIYSIPFQTLYSSSKYAVEALTEGLRIELAPFNVKAALVEPGDIKTGFTAARIFSEGSKNSAYGDEFRHAIAQMEHDEQTGASPNTVVDVIMSVMKKKNPPVRTTVGFVYKLFVFLKRIFPASLVQSILTMMYPKSKEG